jgi:hypothetical protein
VLRAISSASAPAVERRIAALLLPWALILICLLPLWSVRYLPLYDYQNHLLEAQVVARYHDPALGYAAAYRIRDGWQLRSNALWPLIVIDLMRWLPADAAGKLAVSLYIVLLVGGLALLLRNQRRPWWLLLAAPPLVYNLTFTAGMLNWCLGLALTLWALLCYLRWQPRASTRWLLALGGLLLLIYIAHLLAWMLCLVILATLCAVDKLPMRRTLALGVACMSAAPLLALTRPAYVLLPVLIYAALLGTAAAIDRLHLNRVTLGAIGALGVAGYMALWRALRPIVRTWLPDVGYSLDSKLMSFTQLLSLPYQATPVAPEQVLLNLGTLVLAGLVMLLAAWSCWAAGMNRRWLAVLGVLALCYPLLPTRTQEIIVTEPRVLLLALIVGLLDTSKPDVGWMHRSLVALLAALALVASLGAWRYAQHYDTLAQRWATALESIPPAQSVLVFSNPPALDDTPWSKLARLSQIFDPNQFSSVYGLERGGFVSNTFFNGPIAPRRLDAVPPYWWSEYQPASYLQQYCAQLRDSYTYILAWNSGDSPLQPALAACYTTPLTHLASIEIRSR